MSRDSKRNFGYIMTVGVIVLIGHWCNVFLMIDSWRNERTLAHRIY